MNENKFLKDFFTKKYEDSIGDSNFYVAFEDCGFHISKEAFTDAISEQYSKNVEVEQLSNSCNYVIPIGDTIMAHSATSISDCVELLKDSITFNDKKFPENLEVMLPIFGNAKSNLQQQFQTAQSTLDPHNSFYRSNLNPDNFLDESDISNWTPYNESWEFPSTSPDPAQPTENTPKWKIRPELFRNFQLLKNEHEKPAPETPAPAATTTGAATFHAVAARPFARTAMMARTFTPVTASVVAGTAVSAEPVVAVAKPVTVTPVVKKQLTRFFKTNKSLENPSGSESEIQFSRKLVRSNVVNRDILLQRFLVSNAIDKKDDTPVKTSSVNISFKYCISHILRPWLYRNILDTNQTWYCAGLPENFFSSGEPSENNKGKLPSLPVSMILIKDLSITATFNAGDWENAKQAVALDSLNIAEADFKDLGNNKHEIESKGVQIIGWICEYLPKFPVSSDPALI